MAIFLGLAAAITYGAADFLGGLATRSTNVFRVVMLSQIIGSGLFFLSMPIFSDTEPTSRALVWGALAGLAGGTGVLLFYQALAMGRMSVIAPVTGVEAAVVPVIWGLASGERPSAVSLAGVGLALAAVALVSASPQPVPEGQEPSHGVPGLLPALGAGFAFGMFFILLAEAGDDAGLWPLVSGRLASLTLVAAFIILGRKGLRPAEGSMPAIVGAGIFDVAANVLYLVASRRGLLSLVAVLTSMYPASTVLLARVALGERLVRVQIAGLGVAAIGVTLIGIG